MFVFADGVGGKDGRFIKLVIFVDVINVWSLAGIYLMEIQGTVMQIEKTLINDRLSVSKVTQKFLIPAICNFFSNLPVICYFLKK